MRATDSCSGESGRRRPIRGVSHAVRVSGVVGTLRRLAAAFPSEAIRSRSRKEAETPLLSQLAMECTASRGRFPSGLRRGRLVECGPRVLRELQLTPVDMSSVRVSRACPSAIVRRRAPRSQLGSPEDLHVDASAALMACSVVTNGRTARTQHGVYEGSLVSRIYHFLDSDFEGLDAVPLFGAAGGNTRIGG